MSKRNVILIAIILGILAVIILAFMYFYKPGENTATDTSGTNFLSEFFPFGKNKSNTQTGNTPADISGYVPPDLNTTEIVKERLLKVSSMPIAGYGIFTKERYKDTPVIPPTPAQTDVVDTSETKDISKEKVFNPNPTPPQTEFVTALRYVERATGNIYQTFADIIYERKFTTTIIPQVYEAYFGDKGNTVIMRYLKNDKLIETFTGKLQEEVLGGDTTESSEILGSFLPENITDMSISPNKTSIFYVFDNGDTATGVTALARGDKKNQIFSSGFTEWLTSWPNDRMITLTTKPSANEPGFMYTLDPNTKRTKKILGGLHALTTLTSPNGKLILYSDKALNLRIYNIDSRDSVLFAVKTMPEKCTWNLSSDTLYCAVPKYLAGSNYPDTWYQGETSFSDMIWKIDIETGSSVMLADPVEFSKGEDIDGIKLSLDGDENYLFLVNKKDSYLWELFLK